MTEIEVKFRISNIKKLRNLLRKIGAERVCKTLQRDFAYDDNKESLMKGGRFLRLRKTNKGVFLAFKSLKRRGKI